MIDLLSRSNSKGKLGKFLLIALACGLWADAVYAKAEITSVREVVEQQTKKVSGTVTDESGQPLPGVSVFIKGTQRGITTDFDGDYQIQASQGEVLVFSYVGFVTQEKIVPSTGNELVINISLKEETQQLEQVVVTALGIKRQEKALSYNVQQVKSEELTRVKEANFVNSLNGKVAGVTIQRSAAGIGGATKVVMRGLKSLDGNNGVLYVIDGVPMFNFRTKGDGDARFGASTGGEGASDLNPDDIESINVLTGPSAAALYGSEAANGVILINTKKGKEGKMEVVASSAIEFVNVAMLPEFQNIYGGQSGSFRSWGAKLDTPSDYNPKSFFNVGTNLNNSITLSTGNKQNQTFVSIAQTDAEGVVPNNSYYRYNIGARNTTNFLNDKLHLDISANYILQGDRNMKTGGGYYNPLVALYLMPRNLDYKDVQLYERYNPLRGIYEKYQPYPEKIDQFFSENPYWIVNRQMFLSNKKRYMFSASLKYDIFDWLNIAGRVRVDNTNAMLEEKIYASSSLFLTGSTKGRYSNESSRFEQTYADVIINANKYFGEDFNLTANLGVSYNDRYNQGISIGGSLLYVPNLFSANNLDPKKSGMGQLYDRNKNVAVFGSAELGYKRMLYLTLTGRNDWSSQLVNSKEPSFFYPSTGISAVINEMVELPKFINFLKVRGSYTEVGSPISKTGLTPGTITYELNASGLKSNSTYPYPEFKAERTKSWELGVNSKMFNNALGIDVTLYKSNTFNQFFEKELSASSGYTKYFLQAGNVENRGIELGINFNKEIIKDLNWNSSFTYSRNINEIIQLINRDYKNPITGEPFGNQPEDYTQTRRGGFLLKEGGSMADITVTGVLIRDANGNLVEEKGKFKVDKSQDIKVGRSTPDFSIGWRNSFSYKGFDLSFLLNGNFGGVVLSGTQPMLDAFGVSKASAEARNNGGVMVDGKLYDAKKYYESIGGSEALGGYYTYDATNVRLQEAALSYTLDGKVLSEKIKRISFSVTGTNLWMIYNKAPFDPQLTAGVGTYAVTEFFMLPSMRTYGFSMKLQF
ncbi:SusC/RagA family TonB-linked outer membrane protein [Capnocytophaga canimorsus]|uniref:SusC/RagA family TonB-linked outer membrane protein n=1 Tax=Capnocytophaga canimorsus TaxID=28188 RepID=UPI001ACBF104|nr:SusC/RagA family TonB-linked outer membrane protein [Capnocytophaga canimorsus]GIM58460.1 SusC/RagA family TonB-linked outer membrane protein [Capnocytophaga canimorsus]